MKRVLLALCFSSLAQDAPLINSGTNYGYFGITNLVTKREFALFAGGLVTGVVLTKLFWPTVKRHHRHKPTVMLSTPNQGLLSFVKPGVFTGFSDQTSLGSQKIESQKRAQLPNSGSSISDGFKEIYAELDQAQAANGRFNQRLEVFKQDGRDKITSFVQEERSGRLGYNLSVLTRLLKRK